jgi:hypothetical protein
MSYDLRLKLSMIVPAHMFLEKYCSECPENEGIICSFCCCTSNYVLYINFWDLLAGITGRIP